MEKVCAMLGLEMHQKFNVSGGSGVHAEGNPYVFTECGIFNGGGKPCTEMLVPLVYGGLAVEPLPEYMYGCADTVDAGKMRGQEMKVKAASFNAVYGSKALYAVITAGAPDIKWRVERHEEDMEPVRTEFTGFTQAVEAYNGIRMLDLGHD